MPCLKVSSCCGPSGSVNDETKRMRCRRTKARLKTVWTGVRKCTFIVTNGILPLVDVTSDYLTFLSLLDSGDKLFACANLLVKFLSYVIKLIGPELFLIDMFFLLP